MNVLLWILQGALAFLLLSGGGYKVATREELAKQFGGLAPAGWGALGAFEIVGAVLLILPAALNRMPELTAIAALAVVVESAFLVALYARSSRTLSASNPLVWAAAIGLVAAFVAYGRFVLSPLG